MASSEKYMYRCITLAKQAQGNVSPNPMVGAVLVHNGSIIGEGFHEQFGKNHAEVNCLNSVPEDKKHLIKDSTLYVSLEPCSHFGKTPPCTELIISNEIKKLIIGSTDPNPLVSGRGINHLRSVGIEVTEGILKEETDQLNKRFFTFHQKNRPYVILKWAETADRKLSAAEGQKLKISGKTIDMMVHKWRAEEDAIMVGRNTALLDNPQLTTRLWKGKNPLRIVTDPEANLPDTLNLFDGEAPLVVLNLLKDEKHGEVLYKKIKTLGVNEILYALKELNICSVIVEGGAALLNSFITAGLWDEARIIINKDLVAGNGIAAPEKPEGILEETVKIGREEILFLKNMH